MHKPLICTLLATLLAPCLAQEPEKATPSRLSDYSEITPAGWTCTVTPVLRCPAPSFWEDQDGWNTITLQQGTTKTLYLDVPIGRINDILVNPTRQIEIISLQLTRADFVIYIISWEQGKVWLADPSPLDKILGNHAPKEDPQDAYALSPLQLIGLRQTNDKIEGLVRHTSGINPKETGLSMLIRFTIDLAAPQPEHGKPWPITITQIEDSMQEREWNPGNRDFNPPLVKPE